MLKLCKALCTIGMALMASIVFVNLTTFYMKWWPIVGYWLLAAVREILAFVQEVRDNGNHS